jgi:lipopolysaccharide/colanic/teichoic acid biosynthesis glycosyltransferase
MKKELLIKEQGSEAVAFISRYADVQAEGVHVVKTVHSFAVEAIDDAKCHALVNLNKINDIRGINDFNKLINSKLPEKGIFIGCVETHAQRRHRILHKYPLVIAQLYFFFDFIFKRVFPKLKLTRALYFFITAGRNRVLSKAEALGRLVFCGFDILEVEEIKGLTYFACAKTARAIPEKDPSFGFFFRMRRIGKHNQPITVYKIRTMHPYAEYLQEYVYRLNSLQDGGKFKDDFRITSWGRVFRKLWIDELPMIINLLKGEIKLVGVRPLSEHYLSLYNEELKAKRETVKPGLVPPFYADLPVSLEQIMQSELQYINRYKHDAFRTDCVYFYRAFRNIVFKNVRTS